jgi:hypothetical protein
MGDMADYHRDLDWLGEEPQNRRNYWKSDTIHVKEDGTEMLIADMDDKHLKNTIALLKRNGRLRIAKHYEKELEKRLL